MNFDIDKVPQEMKEAQFRMSTVIRRERKAAQQVEIWTTELATAQRVRSAEERVYGDVSQRWDPETNTMKPAREDAPAASS